jgi:hypothetical protein
LRRLSLISLEASSAHPQLGKEHILCQLRHEHTVETMHSHVEHVEGKSAQAESGVDRPEEEDGEGPEALVALGVCKRHAPKVVGKDGCERQRARDLGILNDAFH